MSSADLDRQLTNWMASAGADDVPAGLLDDVFGVTRTSRQRGGVIGRFVTAAIDWWRRPVAFQLVPRQVFYLVVVGLLVVAAAVALATIGARRPAPPFGLAANGLIGFDRDGAVVLARRDGTGISEVATIPDARGPVFAPDGDHVAFYRTVDGVATIMVAEAEGRDPAPISTGVTIDNAALDTPPSWSPDSRRIAFGGLSDGRRQVFIASADGGGLHSIGDAGLSRIDPAWSPDGAWIAFHGYRPDEDAAAGQYRTTAGLYVISPDGRDETALVRGTGGDFIFRKPQWLPDPERSVLAYSIGEPSHYDIATFDLDTMRQTLISAEPAAELWPAWAPDGSTLVWAGSDARIRVARPDGTVVRTLPPDIDYQLVWSPDGDYLIGWSDEFRTSMRIMRSDGSSRATDVTMHGTSRSHWSWQRRAP